MKRLSFSNRGFLPGGLAGRRDRLALAQAPARLRRAAGTGARPRR